MSRLPALLVFVLALSASAAERDVAPDDYKTHPCAPNAACESFDRREFATVAARTQSHTALEPAWVRAHWDEMETAFAPYCAKANTCYATAGNTNIFCDNAIFPTSVAICNRYEQGSHDFAQCNLFVRTYVTGIALKSLAKWRAAQACASASARPEPPRTMDVWMTPATLPLEFNGKFVVWALDAETRVPLQANVTIDGEDLFADTPGGRPMTAHPLKWKTRLVPVRNASGHRDLVPPAVKVEREGYETVTFALPVDLRPLVVEMTPPVSQLKRGKNEVTITARDAKTNEPVEARVMLGEQVLGDTNQPLELELRRGQKRPEIWVTSLFDRYSDVVVAPAEK